jgi:hypothetical protein
MATDVYIYIYIIIIRNGNQGGVTREVQPEKHKQRTHLYKTQLFMARPITLPEESFAALVTM